jgi:hypothetical protein
MMITAAVCYVPRESNFNAEQKGADGSRLHSRVLYSGQPEGILLLQS